MSETIYINVNEPRAGVIMYYAVLAYPDRVELERRRQFSGALVAMRVKEFARQLGGRQNAPAIYTGFKNEKIYGALRRGWKRLAKRLTAGQVGWNILLSGTYEASTADGKKEVAVPGANTIEMAMKSYVRMQGREHRYGDQEAVKNAIHRVWAESLPPRAES